MKNNAKIFGIIIIVVLFINLVCTEFNYYRSQRELRNISKSLTEAQQTIVSIGDRLGQQESIIGELREGQRITSDTITRLEELQSDIVETVAELRGTVGDIERTVIESSDTLGKLTESESRVDGSIGAIRGTAKQLEDSLRITVAGLDETEIQQNEI